MEKLVGNIIERLLTDKGYRCHNAPPDYRFRVCISGQKRDVTPSIKRTMRRRSAIEPVIGHLKAEHRMGGNHLWFKYGDAVNAVLAAVGYNFRRLIRWLSLLLRQNPGRPLRPTPGKPAEIGNLHGRLLRCPNEINLDRTCYDCSACNYASFARRKCDEQTPSPRLKARDFRSPKGTSNT
jgi:hypothetical protein